MRLENGKIVKQDEIEALECTIRWIITVKLYMVCKLSETIEVYDEEDIINQKELEIKNALFEGMTKEERLSISNSKEFSEQVTDLRKDIGVSIYYDKIKEMLDVDIMFERIKEKIMSLWNELPADKKEKMNRSKMYTFVENNTTNEDYRVKLSVPEEQRMSMEQIVKVVNESPSEEQLINN